MEIKLTIEAGPKLLAALNRLAWAATDTQPPLTYPTQRAERPLCTGSAEPNTDRTEPK